MHSIGVCRFKADRNAKKKLQKLSDMSSDGKFSYQIVRNIEVTYAKQ